jgi:hypothetical protein
MIEGALILLAGILIGGVGVRVLDRFPRTPSQKAIKPRCSCNHAPSFHDPKTGRCHYAWTERLNYHDTELTCTCRRYDGPEPLPEFYAPEILP